MLTDADIRRQVTQAVTANGPALAEGIDIDAVVREIIAAYGLVDIDEIGDNFWEIVARNDSTQA
jgi:hypothetical protein